MEAISSQLQDMYKDSICQFHSGKKSADSLSKRLNKLEKGMNRILEILAPEPGALTNDVSLSAVEIAGKMYSGHMDNLSYINNLVPEAPLLPCLKRI